jgi:hypothetical protein
VSYSSDSPTEGQITIFQSCLFSDSLILGNFSVRNGKHNRVRHGSTYENWDSSSSRFHIMYKSTRLASMQAAPPRTQKRAYCHVLAFTEVHMRIEIQRRDGLLVF